jgi:putative SOS response-associated peptidase YedK
MREKDLKMDFFDRPQTLLEDRQYNASRSMHKKRAASMSHSRRRWLFFRKPPPVIVRDADHNEVKHLWWGLVRSWAQDASIGQRMINARAETLLEKPSFTARFNTAALSSC